MDAACDFAFLLDAIGGLALENRSVKTTMIYTHVLAVRERDSGRAILLECNRRRRPSGPFLSGFLMTAAWRTCSTTFTSSRRSRLG